jgi:hypothetical protein
MTMSCPDCSTPWEIDGNRVPSVTLPFKQPSQQHLPRAATNQPQKLPPTPHPPCPWQDTMKRSPRKSSGLKTKTLIFEFAQTMSPVWERPFSARAWREEELGPECEDRVHLGRFLLPPRGYLLGFKAAQETMGSEDKQTMNGIIC